MEAPRLALLAVLSQQGQAHDACTTVRAERLLNITPDTGPFLALLVRLMQARQVLEVGTSNGYSTIWLADAVQPLGGHVTTIEANPAKLALAHTNFAQADVADLITPIAARAETWLLTCQTSFDFIFLDADRAQYVALWPRLLHLLRPGGLLVVDNAVSHQTNWPILWP